MEKIADGVWQLPNLGLSIGSDSAGGKSIVLVQGDTVWIEQEDLLPLLVALRDAAKDLGWLPGLDTVMFSAESFGMKAETRERRWQVLVSYNGQSTAELAAQLGVSQQTIRSDLYWLRLGRYASVPRPN